jgi:hypothetical protein
MFVFLLFFQGESPLTPRSQEKVKNTARMLSQSSFWSPEKFRLQSEDSLTTQTYHNLLGIYHNSRQSCAQDKRLVCHCGKVSLQRCSVKPANSKIVLAHIDSNVKLEL